MSEQPINGQHLLEMLTAALTEARVMNSDKATVRECHHERSSNWVKALAEGFRAHYKRDDHISVFSRDRDCNREDFTLNELLYDVSVVRTGTVKSSHQGIELFFIREAVWQIESEFERNGRSALVDFNKLVLGSAPNKLFIGPKSEGYTKVMNEVLIKPAACCGGNVYCALVPHPDQWDSDPSGPQLHLFEHGIWELVEPAEAHAALA